MLTRERLEIAIVATELSGIMDKIRRRSTPQLRAMLRESKANHGELTMGYGAMRQLIVDVGEMFAHRPDDDSPVTPEPGSVQPPSEASMARARAEFR